MIIIACSLSLLAIVSGMFLLAKTQKDNLSNMFKYVAYFVIIAGFFHVVVGGALFTMRTIYNCGAEHFKMENTCEGMHGKHMKNKKCKRMSMSCDKMGDENCEKGMMMNEGKCMETGKDCCANMKGMKDEKSSCMKGNMMMKKDSVVIKK